MVDTIPFDSVPISCHAWNADKSQIALSLNDEDVNVYNGSGTNWKLMTTLTAHGARVTSIDWAPKSNRIVTCASDRNAYVWTMNNDEWQPTMVLLRINRAATCVKWSPDENKIAVGTGAKLVAVCYFEKANNWWVSKHIKKPIRSTVKCLDWHPNGSLLATGGCDLRARVFSALVKEIESGKPPENCWTNGKKQTFGTALSDFSSCGWVHAVQFSPSGELLVFVGHDSTITLVNGSNEAAIITIKTNLLPFTSLLWLDENRIVAAGYDCIPYVYHANRNLNLAGQLDEGKSREDQQNFKAMDMFNRMTRLAIDSVSTNLPSVHQNSISQLSSVQGGRGAPVNVVASTGLDGQLVLWNLNLLEKSMTNLRVS